MAAAPARSQYRRPRPGSLERPVSARMYRGTWLLVGLPLLVAAFSVARPTPLPAPPLPPAFDRNAATALATDLARSFPDRSPGSPGATGAVQWFEQQLQAYGFRTQVERFEATIPGRGRVRLENLSTVAPGSSPDTIVVMAHRDNAGTSPGANDNASGTAALIELARGYANVGGGRRATPAHRILSLSFPFSLYEQAPFVGRGIPAITLTSAGDRPPPAFGDTPEHLDRIRLTQLGGSAQELISSLDQGLDLAQGTSTYVYLGSRIVRGWAIELVLIATLLPFFAATVDLFARCRLPPGRRPAPGGGVAGYTAALLALGVVSLLVVATNAFALVLLLPSLHAWLWLPESRARPPWTRAAILVAGFAGPL